MAQKRHEERRAYWRQKINDFKQSGQTQREFCKQNNLSYWSFNSWNRRLSKETGETPLVEISSSIINKAYQPTDEFELITESGLRIKVPDNFKPETLSGILEVLGTGK